MANVYIEQYRNALRDDGGAVASAPGALMKEGSAVIVASGEGGTLELASGVKFIYVRAVGGECFGGFTSNPSLIDDDAALEHDRYDLPDGPERWITVVGTHFSAILKADA